MAIVNDHAMFQPDYLAQRVSCNPLNVSKRAGKPRVFVTDMPYKQEIITRMRNCRSEAEILAGMLMLPLPPGPVTKFFSSWIGFKFYLDEVNSMGLNSDNFVVNLLKFFSKGDSRSGDGLESARRAVSKELDRTLPAFNINVVIDGLYSQAMTWYETIYCAGDIGI